MQLVRGLFAIAVTAAVLGCDDDTTAPSAGDMQSATPEVLRVTSFPLKYALSGTAFGYRALLSKPGQATWSLTSGPSGATIDAAGGLVTWTPSDAQGGANDFVLHADLNGESVEQSFRVQTAVVKIEATGAIDPANPNGGSITVDAPLSPVRGSAIQLQPGTLPPGQAVTLTISSVQNLPPPPLAQVAGLGASDLLPIEFGPTGTAFQKPVNLTLPAPAAVLAKGHPTVQTFDYATNRWSSVPVLSVDAAGGVVVAAAPHFTPFVLSPGVTLYNLALDNAGAACGGALLVKAPLALTFAQLPASSVNGYSGSGSSVADVLAGLAPGQTLQVYTALHAQTGDATAAQDGWLLASATLQMDGSFKVAVTSDAHAPVGVNAPPTVAASDVEGWLNGSRVDALFGGLAMGLASGASVSAELSLYLVDATQASTPPVQAANPVGKDTLSLSSVAALTGYDSDCDEAPDAFDDTPNGTPPPTLVGTPANVSVTVGTPVPLKVTATGAPMLQWSASDPSVMLQPSADGLSATATPTLAGQFHVDVVGTAGSGTARFSFGLAANPPTMTAPPPPYVGISASSNTVKAGGSVLLTAFAKSPLPLTFTWTAPMGTLSSSSGPSAVFTSSIAGDYTITCVGNDGTQSSAPATLTISVLAANANQPPPAPAVTPMSALLQHGQGQGVMAVLSASAVDPDGDTVTYDFQPDPTDPVGFMLVKSGSSATFYSSSDGVYVFYVTATDSHGAVSPWTPVKLQVSPTLPPMPVDADLDGYPAGIDCNDNDPTIHPGAKEICGDGIDQDCAGGDLSIGDCDADGDRYSINQLDCNDHDPARNPGAVERCDGVDNNCNGQTDEGFAVGQSCTVGVGACAANGTNTCNAALNGVSCNATPGTPHAEVCNDVDDDCNGKVDDVSGSTGGDVNNCGGCNIACTAPAHETAACINGGCSASCQAGFVDVDHNAANGCECQITNGGVEACDGIDNDCNGLVDDNTTQVFYDGPAGTLGIGVCSSGVRSCVSGTMQVTKQERLPGAELCNGVDDNCDGKVDETFMLGTDASNCGKCGVVCSSGMCSSGMCLAAAMDMGTATADMATGCMAGQVLCPSGCTTLVNDDNNCGACGNKCAPSQFCMQTMCVPRPVDMAQAPPPDMATAPSDASAPGDGGVGVSCPAPFTSCAGGCEYLPSDYANCGTCGHACAPSEVCQANLCSAGGMSPQGGTCAANTDCSGGMACFGQAQFGFPGGYCSALCDAQRACPSGTKCSPYLPGTAGACLRTCTVPTDCAGGYLCLGGMCQPDCRNNPSYCHSGQVCDPTGQCVTGTPPSDGGVVVACSAPFSACGSGCQDFTDDPANCGGCGTACGPTGVCSGGPTPTCAMPSPTALGFGQTCSVNTDCTAGLFCVSQARFNWPGGFCTSFCDATRPCGPMQKCVPTNSPNSPGICELMCGVDADCRSGYICNGGTCQPGCTSNPTKCAPGTTCNATTNHCEPTTSGDGGTCLPSCSGILCGSPDGCGGSCPPGSGCTSCPPGFSICNGECIALADDPLHCGSCQATACGGAQVCQASMCATANGTSALGAACTQNTDCAPGDNCIDQMRFGFPGGTCSQFCDPMRPCADPAYACFVFAGGQQAGVCLAKCTMDSQCRSGYVCNGVCQPDCRQDATWCHTGQTCDGTSGRCIATSAPDMSTGGSCPPPNQLCGAVCTNLQFDSMNCGMCGRVCAAGQTCSSGMCVQSSVDGGTSPGDMANPCPPGQSFCGGTCINTSSDPSNCGGCGRLCPAGYGCASSQCIPPGAVCAPGMMQSCYTGSPTTLNVGACHSGTQQCMPNGQWDTMCGGQVTPMPEMCGNGVDDDCDGVIDNGCPLAAVTHSFIMIAGDTQQLVAAGGTPPYTWSVQSGAGAINASSQYQAPSPGSAVLQVQDSAASPATATINVDVVSVPPVSLTPSSGLFGKMMPPMVTMQTAVHSTITSLTWAGKPQPPPPVDANGVAQLPLQMMPDGTYTLAVQVSGFGATTNSGTGSYTFDTTPPAPPSITSPSAGASLAGPTVQVVGLAEANSTVQLNDSANGMVGQGFADAAGNWSITTSALLTGQHSLSAIAADPAGNSSPASASVSFTVTSGTAAPLAANPSSPQVQSGGGIVFTATGGTPPYNWAMVNSGSGGSIDTAGNYIAGSTVADDTVSVTDSATPAATVQVVIHVAGPLTVTISQPANNATLPAGQSVQVSGTTSPSAMLSYLVDGKPFAGGGADPTGLFNTMLPGSFPSGAHTLEVDATLGPSSGKATVIFSIAASSGPMIQLTSPINGASASNPVTLAGISDPNVQVQVALDGMMLAGPFASNGSWSVPVMQTLTSGAHSWQAQATDAMNNHTLTPVSSFNVP